MILWLRNNLFSSWFNTLITLTILYLLWQFAPSLLSWTVINADWIGSSRDDCDSGGACWVFVSVSFNQFIYGFYPSAEQWRVNLAFALLITLMTPLFIDKFRWKWWLALAILSIYPLIAWLL